MLLGVEQIAHGGGNRLDAVLGHHIGQFAQGQFDPFGVSGGLRLEVLGHRIESAAQVVVDRQQIAGEAGRAILLGLAPVTLTALAGVFGVGQRAHEAVLHLVTLGAESGELFALDKCLQIGEFHVFRAHFFGNLVLGRHVLSCLATLALGPLGDQPPDKLGGVVNDRNDPAIIQPGRANDANGADDLSIGVHIGRNHQSGTRK